MATGDERGEGGFAGRFFGVVCRYKPLLGLLLTVEILLVLLSVVAIPQNAPGTGGRIVLTLTLAVNVPSASETSLPRETPSRSPGVTSYSGRSGTDCGRLG